ncbi:MAG: hypothetical protein RIA69_05540, partial [Cyclobacteriaceae bacterium]
IFNRNSKERIVLKDTHEMNLEYLSSVISEFSQYCDHLMLAINDGNQIYIRAFGDDYIIVYSSRDTQGALTLYFRTYKLSQEITLVVTPEKKTFNNGLEEEKEELTENIDIDIVERSLKNETTTKESKIKKSKVSKDQKHEDKSQPRERFSIERIQRRFLRQNNILSYFPRSLFHYQPKDTLSSDFLWIRKFDDGIIRFALADCQIEGDSGAHLALFLNSILDQYDFTNNETFTQFHAWLNNQVNAHNLNSVMSEDEEDDINVNISLITVNTLQNTLNIKNIGNGLILASGNNFLEEVKIDLKEPSEFQTELDDKTHFFLYTNGIQENELMSFREIISGHGKQAIDQIDVKSLQSIDRDDDLTLVGFRL